MDCRGLDSAVVPLRDCDHINLMKARFKHQIHVANSNHYCWFGTEVETLHMRKTRTLRGENEISVRYSDNNNDNDNNKAKHTGGLQETRQAKDCWGSGRVYR